MSHLITVGTAVTLTPPTWHDGEAVQPWPPDGDTYLVLSLSDNRGVVYATLRQHGAAKRDPKRRVPLSDLFDVEAVLFERHRAADPHCSCSACLEWADRQHQAAE